MARTNVAPRPSVFTHEGAPAKRIDAEAMLRRSVMACLLWEDEFYEGGETIANRIAELVTQVSPETAAAVATEAREVMHLRHAPLWVVRAMAPAGGRIVGDTLARIIQRADELAEFVAFYWKDGKSPLSAQVKRGLAEAFTKFDAYALGKYNRDGAVKLRDVLFLTHARPKDSAQAKVWRQLADGTLPVPETWEVLLSAGNDKAAVFTHLLLERKLGGLALLRNLRNMLQVGVDRALIREAINEHRFDRVLPFRFIAAAKHAPELEPELEQAMFRAASTLDRLRGRTALVIDHSGSMADKLSERSELTRFEAAAGLAIMLREVCADVDVIAFSAPLDERFVGYRMVRGTPGHIVRAGWPGYEDAMDVGVGRPPVAVVPPRRGFALRDAIEQAVPWSGTHTNDAKVFADARGYDRILIVTDEQSHQALSAPQGRGYVVNVASNRNGIGYGQWTHIDGWSEGVVRYIHAAESES